MSHGVQAWVAHRAEWSCEKTHLMMDLEAIMLLLVKCFQLHFNIHIINIYIDTGKKCSSELI